MSDLLPWHYNTLVVLAGACLLGASTGLVGSFAVLRQRALVGDALAHATLPGLCLAFYLVGEKSLPLMLAGALLTGTLGVLVVTFLRGSTRVKEDAAIGIVLGVFFGVGMALSRMIQNQTSTGSKAGLDSFIYGKMAGMIAADVYLIAAVALACLLVVVVLYKEMKLVAFDPGFARVQGWPAQPLDFLLMALIAVTVVIGLVPVGPLLMAALLILPGAAARFWTDRLGTMLWVSGGIGLVVGAAGTLISDRYSHAPTGAVTVLAGAAVFFVSLLLAPRRGAVARYMAQAAFRRRLAQQKLLRAAWERLEGRRAPPAVLPADQLAAALGWPRHALVRQLRRAAQAGLIESDAAGQWRFTPEGLRHAARLVRGHRLWELFLTEHAELAAGYADLDAESIDQRLPEETIATLERKLRQQGRWPEGLTA